MLWARSAEECRLYIDLNPCACGEADLPVRHHLRNAPDGNLAAVYEGQCPKCSTQRSFVFTLDPAMPPPAPAYGGAAPSRIICPGQFALVSDYWARKGLADPTGLSAADRKASRASAECALAALAEVIKFIPANADAVASEAFTSDMGRQAYAAEPGRFRRIRLEAVAEAYRGIVAAHDAAG